MRLNWQHWNKALSATQCEKITKLCYNIGTFKEATIFKDKEYVPSNDIRETQIAWVKDVELEQICKDSLYDRKLSIIIQLSDPTTYEGGDFQFKELEQPQGFRDQGSILVFPSYNVHRITEVTGGTRNSIVCWMEGPRWR